MGVEDLPTLKCYVTWSIVWFLGFTLVLCWSIWQLPDAGGCGIKAAWVPDAFCREACLIPLCPVVFALPSIFWPVTLVVIITQQIEARCGIPLAFWRNLTSTPEIKETKYLLFDEESYIGYEEEGSIPLGDLSDDSSHSSDDETMERLPYHMRASRAIRAHFSSRFRSMQYQKIAPAVF